MRGAGERAAALALHAEASAEAPDRWEVTAAWLESLAHYGAKADMARVCSHAIEVSPDPVSTAAKGGELLARSGAMDEAIAVLEQAANRAGAQAGLRLVLAEALHRRKRLVARRNAALEQYVAAVGDDPEGLVAAGRAWWRYGEDRRALALARRAQRLAPGAVGPALLVADAERAAGHSREEQAALAAAAAGPDAPAAALAIGLRWLEVGDPAQALPWLSRAAEAEALGVRRQAERALGEAWQRSRPPDDLEAGTHLRRWLALVPPDEREAALGGILEATLNIPKLQDLRMEALAELQALHPDDAPLSDELAHLHLVRHELGRATAVWRAHVVASQSPSQAAARIGSLLLERGHEDEALDFLASVDAGLITKPQLHRQLGVLYARRGETDRADACFQRFLELTTDPEHRRELEIFAATMTKMHREDLARLAWERLLERSPDDRDALRGLGTALLALGEREAARQRLDAFIEQTAPSQRRRATELVGDLYLAAGDLQQAGATFEALMMAELPAVRSGVFTKLARIRQRMGDMEGLRRAVGVLVTATRSRSRRVQDAASVLSDAGLLSEAVALVDEALAGGEASGQLLDLAAELALRQGSPERAVALVERRVRLGGGTAEAWATAARSLSRAGQPRAALALLDRAQAPVSDAPELLLQRGTIQVALGEHDAAEQSFTAALTRSRAPREVIAAVDGAWRAAGQFERSRRFHARATALAPDRAEHALALGRLWLEAGDLAEAQRSFARYLGLQDRGHLAVARAYGEAGYVDQAVQHTLRAFEQQPAADDDWPLSDAVHFLVEHGRAELLVGLARLEVTRSRKPEQAVSAAARALLEAGELDEALALLERAATEAPAIEHGVLRGLLLLIGGRVDEASLAFARYIDVAEESQSSMLRVPGLERAGRGNAALADVLQALVLRGRPEAALAQARRAVALYGDNPWLAAREAEVLARMGRVDEAMARVRRVEGGLGGAPDEVLGLVRTLERRDRLGAAAEVAELATSRRWDDRIGDLQLRLLIRTGDLAGAERLAARWVASTSPAAAALIAQAGLEEGYLGFARRYAERALGPLGSSGSSDAMAVLDAVAAELGPRGRATPRPWLSDALPDRLRVSSVRAELAFRAGELTVAREALDRALALAPNRADLLRMDTALAALAGDRQAIVAAVQRAGTGERSRPEALDELVRQLDDAGQPALALIPAEALAAIEVGSPARAMRLVILALRAGRDAEARAYADRMLEVCGREPGLVLSLAELWARWLRGDEARRLLEGLDGLRGQAAARRDAILAEAALGEGDVAAALEALEHAVAVAPDGAVARVEAAERLLRWDVAPEQALAFVTPAASGDSPPPPALAMAARAAWRAHQPEVARGHVATLVHRYPALGEGLPELVEAAFRAGDPEGAELAANAMLVQVGVPGATRVAASAAVAGVVAARPDPDAPPAEGASPDALERSALAAEELIARALEDSSLEVGDAALRVAALDEARGLPERAVAAYEDALARHPASVAAIDNLADAVARLGGDLERALDRVREASRRRSDPAASFLDTEAWLLHRLGRDHEALVVIRRALALYSRGSPSDARSLEVLYHLGAIEAATGDRAAARATWRDCARRDPGSRYGALCLQLWRPDAGVRPAAASAH
ncbi:MAG: hypothetical protein H6746_12590 [Deltaproteobacteria bacterium]|nr:hypothetical protein [Deltaproteobacteria bacterium]